MNNETIFWIILSVVLLVLLIVQFFKTRESETYKKYVNAQIMIAGYKVVVEDQVKIMKKQKEMIDQQSIALDEYFAKRFTVGNRQNTRAPSDVVVNSETTSHHPV